MNTLDPRVSNTGNNCFNNVTHNQSHLKINFFDYFSLSNEKEDNQEIEASPKEEAIWLIGDSITATRQALIISAIAFAVFFPPAAPSILEAIASTSLVVSGAISTGSGLAWMAPRAQDRLARAELESNILEKANKDVLHEGIKKIDTIIESFGIIEQINESLNILQQIPNDKTSKETLLDSFRESIAKLQPLLIDSTLPNQSTTNPEDLLNHLKQAKTALINTLAKEIGLKQLPETLTHEIQDLLQDLHNEFNCILTKLSHNPLEDVELEKINVLNQKLFTALGVVDTSSGVVSMLNTTIPEVASCTPILETGIATVALTILGAISGILSIIRGLSMYYRASRCEELISSFQNIFMDTLNSADGINNASNWIAERKDELKSRVFTETDIEDLNLSEKEKSLLGILSAAEEAEISNIDFNKQSDFTDAEKTLLKKKYSLAIVYLSRRLGASMAEKIMLSKAGEITPAFLAEIDHAIYTEQSKLIVLKSVGMATALLGVGSLLAIILTGGAAALPMTIANAIFTMSSEWLFILYDRLSITKDLSDYFYKISRSQPIHSNEDISLFHWGMKYYWLENKYSIHLNACIQEKQKLIRV